MYLLFAYDNYYPSGGWWDFKGRYDSLDSIKEYLKKNRYDCFDIIDAKTLEKVQTANGWLKE